MNVIVRIVRMGCQDEDDRSWREVMQCPPGHGADVNRVATTIKGMTRLPSTIFQFENH